MTTLPDPAPSSIDNPWLQLLLDSNQRDPDNPTAYWNAMQDGLIIHGFWKALEGYKPSSTGQLQQDELKAFYGRLDTAGVTDEIHFVGVKFKEVEFTQAKFLRSVSFNKAEFYHNANFERAQFFNKSSFVETEFRRSACFKNTSFQGYANFESAQFCVSTNEPRNKRKVVFAADFLDEGSFQKSKFGVQTTFAASQNTTGAVPSKDLHFNGATFDKPVSFWNVSCKAIGFEATEFHKKATFYGF